MQKSAAKKSEGIDMSVSAKKLKEREAEESEARLSVECAAYNELKRTRRSNR